jgi:hypothetical protein
MESTSPSELLQPQAQQEILMNGNLVRGNRTPQVPERYWTERLIFPTSGSIGSLLQPLQALGI